VKKSLVLILMGTSFLLSNVYVKGYFKSNGTYVAPHFRSDPDKNFYNNWSTIGNYNPYTGKKGYKKYPNKKHIKSFFDLYN